MIPPAPPPSWADLPFFREAWPGIRAALAAETRPILPPAPGWFRALEMVPPEAARVVVLGQDPYPQPGNALGLAFSVSPGVRLPPSLRNIFRELADDLGAAPPNGDLSGWARQGVLLLNTVLTVPQGQSNGHARLGWQRLALEVLARLDDRPRAFLLWGRPAQELGAGLKNSGHLKIETTHPSPLSAGNTRATVPPFFGSRPFARVNTWLAARGEQPIDWAA